MLSSYYILDPGLPSAVPTPSSVSLSSSPGLEGLVSHFPAFFYTLIDALLAAPYFLVSTFVYIVIVVTIVDRSFGASFSWKQ